MFVTARKPQNKMGGGTGHHRCDISILRLMATLCVVMIHTCNTITNNTASFAGVTEWELKELITVNCLVNWGVPMFFMITGCLLLKKDTVITYDRCIRRYAKRVMLALLVFGIPFSWMEIIAETKSVSLQVFSEGLLRTVGGNSWGHLWYLYELIGIYLILPVIKAFTDSASKSDFRVALGVMFAFNLCFVTVNAIYPLIGFYLPIRTNALFYLMLGRYLEAEKENISIRIGKYVLIFCMAALILIGITTDKETAAILTGYSSPFTALMSTAVFILVSGSKSGHRDVLWKLDRLCFGVYLVHPIFTNLFYKFLHMTPLLFGRFILVGIFGFFLLFTMLGFFVSWIMNKIPILRKYVL